MSSYPLVAAWVALFVLLVGATELPPLERLEWTIPERYAAIEGNRLVIDIPLSDYPQSAVAAARIDPRMFRDGGGYCVSVMATGTNIAKPTKEYLGFKCQLHWGNVRTGVDQYPNAMWEPGSFSNRLFVVSAAFAGTEPEFVVLQLGLQETCGRVEFDLSSLRGGSGATLFVPKNADKIVTYPPRVFNDIARCGVMLPSRTPTAADFQTLKSWRVTLVRYQMVRGWNSRNDNRDVDEFGRWLGGKLDDLERIVLPLARENGMKVVVDLHVPPGGRAANGEMNMFKEKFYARAFLDCWRRIATRFRGNEDVIYGYDLINEPEQQSPAQTDYLELQEKVAREIRTIDPETPIIVESNGWDAPFAFSYLSPIGLDNVIYQVHFYLPMEFTHQGVSGGKGRVSYPDSARGWSRAYLAQRLSPVREFSRRHKAKIYVGEFSAVAWADGADRYLADCISLFKEYGWDWTYHAFREWPGWSVEHEGDDAGHLRPSADNPRKKALLNGLCGH